MGRLYTLYWGPEMGSAAVQAVLSWGNFPHHLAQVNFGNSEHKTAAYLTLNPAGKIPALGLPDGTLLTESGAMILYLSDLVPDKALMPAMDSPLRAQALQWLFFLASEVYPQILLTYHPSAFVDGDAACKSLADKATQTLDKLSDILVCRPLSQHRFILNEQLSAVDIYAAMLLSWHPNLRQLCQRQPHISALIRDVWANPHVDQAFRHHRLHPPQMVPRN